MSTQPIRRDDDILMELAIFYETEGLKRAVAEEVIQERYNEFKARIQSKGITLEDLAIMVYKKYGKKPYPAEETNG